MPAPPDRLLAPPAGVREPSAAPLLQEGVAEQTTTNNAVKYSRLDMMEV